MFNTDAAMLVVSLITSGLGLTFGFFDIRSRSSRAMALFLVLLGLNMVVNPDQSGRTWHAFAISLYALTFATGIEWANRIGVAAAGRRRKAATALFRAAQCVVLAYWIVGCVYALFMQPASRANEGIVQTTGLEFALFAPLLGTVMLLSVIAGALLATTRLDSADKLRLRVLGVASPFLISGLIFDLSIVPFTMALGILVLCSGAIRYLMIQGRRGQFMSQFLAPEVAELVRDRGLEQVMRRERRVLSVVVCDLRGYTAYAREHDSNEVIELLERFYRAVGSAAASYGGTIKDHAGDGVLILVGAPIPKTDHARQALLLATDLMQRGREVLDEAGLLGTVGLGIGVATGQITVGTIRGAGQLEYVAVGNAVNLAARLCDRAMDGEILSDTRTAEESELRDSITFIDKAPEPLKGFAEPIDVCAIGSPA